MKVNPKYLTMKPEVKQIFEDLEDYLEYCKDNMVKYDPADLYKSEQWRKSKGLARGSAAKRGNKPTKDAVKS